VTVRVLRRPGPDGYQAYPVAVFPRMSVLDALFAIQREQDRTLSFRYSCRLGMCGTCPVIVNGREGLACQTLVEALPGDTVTLRPLNHLPVLKDLVVDLEPFFDRYRRVKPHFVPRERGDAPEAAAVIRQGEGGRRWVDPALGCITCAICHSACSVVGLNERFPGPAPLNRAYTLVGDERDGARAERLASAGGADGVWRCHQLFNCASACPRHLVPTQAIRQLRLEAGGEMAGPLSAPLRWLRGRRLPLAGGPGPRGGGGEHGGSGGGDGAA
jgi:succinate dehydrogenase / fumarate reductase iron-sulfur subunit/fumarate reductase iron-sulfur subunit